MFKSKQKKVQSQISEYCREADNCLEVFKSAFHQHCENPDMEAIKRNFCEVHKAESLADDIRGEIEIVMYSKALFPESRGDILGLLETMDRVPNQAESAVRMAMNQRITIPREFCPSVLQLVDVCRRCGSAMIDAVEKLFEDYTIATVAVGKIDELESEADRIESKLIEGIFAGDMDGFDKILLRDLVKHIAQIPDRAENVGDRIRVIVAKRSV